MRKNLIPPPIWALLWAALMWTLHHWMPLAQPVVPPWNRLGWGVGVLGLALTVNAVHRFRIARTTLNPVNPSKAAKLVTSGSYRLSRNPMYLGLLLLLGGWGLWLGSLSPLLLLPMFVVLLTYLQIIPEERTLASRFGDDYLDYTRRVGRWVGGRRVQRSGF